MNYNTIRCPKCNSAELHIDKRGFKTGNAVVGGVVTGNLLTSLVAGGIGMNKIQITCLKCGHKFNAGEAYTTTSIEHDRNMADFEAHVRDEWEKTAIYRCDCGREACLPIDRPVCPKCGRWMPISKQFKPEPYKSKGCLPMICGL